MVYSAKHRGILECVPQRCFNKRAKFKQCALLSLGFKFLGNRCQWKLLNREKGTKSRFIPHSPYEVLVNPGVRGARFWCSAGSLTGDVAVKSNEDESSYLQKNSAE